MISLNIFFYDATCRHIQKNPNIKKIDLLIGYDRISRNMVDGPSERQRQIDNEDSDPLKSTVHNIRHMIHSYNHHEL